MKTVNLQYLQVNISGIYRYSDGIIYNGAKI